MDVNTKRLASMIKRDLTEFINLYSFEIMDSKTLTTISSYIQEYLDKLSEKLGSVPNTLPISFLQKELIENILRANDAGYKFESKIAYSRNNNAIDVGIFVKSQLEPETVVLNFIVT